MVINNKEDFEKSVSSLDEFKFIGNKPTLLKMSASWCGPCKRINPIVEELSEEFSDRVDIYSIDIEQVPEVASMFGIQSVPTLIYIKADGTFTAKTGAYPKAEFIDDFKNILGV